MGLIVLVNKCLVWFMEIRRNNNYELWTIHCSSNYNSNLVRALQLIIYKQPRTRRNEITRCDTRVGWWMLGL